MEYGGWASFVIISIAFSYREWYNTKLQGQLLDRLMARSISEFKEINTGVVKRGRRIAAMSDEDMAQLEVSRVEE